MKLTFELTRKAKDIITNSQVFRAIHNLIGDETPIYLNNSTASFMNAYKNNYVVYSVISPIVKRCATMGLTTPSGKVSKEFEQLLNKPNPLTTKNEFIQSVITNLAVCGCAFIWKNRVGTKVVELWNVPAKDIEIYPSSTLGIRAYKFSWRTNEIPAEDVIFLRLPNPDNTNPGENITGLSPLNSCLKVITEADEAVMANAKMMKNRMPRTMLSARANAMITETQMKDLEKQVQEAGTKDKFFATSAPLQAAAFGLSPVDLNIHETLKRAKRDIASVYGVPFEYFEPSTYSNKNDAKQDFINNAVIPVFSIFIDGLNYDPDMIALSKEPLIIDMQSVPELRKDLVSLSGAMASSWWLSGDEKRAAMDYEPSGNELMKTFIMPAGMQTIDMIELDMNTVI